MECPATPGGATLSKPGWKSALHGLFGLAVLFAPLFLLASELTVTPGRLTVDDVVTVTLTLEGSFAAVDSPLIPTRNLTLSGSPSVSSEFRWVNGVSSRRKVLRYTARPVQPGLAVVGPLLLKDEKGRELRLAEVRIDVLPGIVSNSDRPEETLRQLEELSRERVFIQLEVTQSPVTVGQQLVATWFLYAADPIRDFHVVGNPTLVDFWVEEIPLGNPRPAELTLGGRQVQRLPIRRAALFPLRPGKLEIASLEAVVEVLRPIESPFGIFGGRGVSPFEGSLVDVRRRAPSRTIEVLPVSGGPSPAAVGSFDLQCSQPRVPAVGPVSIDVSMSGTGNLRSSRAPQFTQPVDGRVEVEEGPVQSDVRGDDIYMKRSWKVLLFPARGGSFVVPTLAIEIYDPEMRMRRTLQCAGRALVLPRPSLEPPGPVAPPSSSQSTPGSDGRSRWWVAGVLAVSLTAWLIFQRSGRRSGTQLLEELMALRHQLEELRRNVNAVASRIANTESLFEESSELGESYRALHSWIDILEKEPERGREATEIEKRLRRWVEAYEAARRGGDRKRQA